jgi:hypothetical protein
MTWATFWKALAVSAASGAVAAATDAVQETPSNGKAVAIRAAVGAGIGAVAYLKQSPLPPAPPDGK